MSAQFYTLKNNFIEVTLTNYGARMTSIIINANGQKTEVTGGFNNVDDYLKATAPFYGATIGRFGNRIANGKFELNGKHYQLPINNGPNSLHGGSGFHDKLWQVTSVDDVHVSMAYVSADGEDGYPGKLTVTLVFTLLEDGVSIDYSAQTDAPTVINLTNHNYYNLNGEGNGDILKHTLYVNADALVAVNSNLIPTGELMPVEGTAFDFRKEQKIGPRINDAHEQMQTGNGYDHTYVLNKPEPGDLTLAGRLTGDISGIYLDVYTTEPGMQVYTGNFMDGTNTFQNGAKDDFRTMVALETQHFPDSPNHPEFPSTVLNPDETFTSASVYRFGVKV
ncbi:aldose 1-epimerase [Mucilaginibacter yixingensis]|uniref:Aldose 1-epimerase n=1 Tax=Mucilaginibacter yixingensis TaxID=1295612 RepID=A0A2T5JEM9_9SPHI|nr:aldose epimerase family protein [Mucilaginibacter yixingensis]PTR00902.1 aldose 1-epimerase [Mucilaginibacter yixingensis]